MTLSEIASQMIGGARSGACEQACCMSEQAGVKIPLEGQLSPASALGCRRISICNHQRRPVFAGRIQGLQCSLARCGATRVVPTCADATADGNDQTQGRRGDEAERPDTCTNPPSQASS